MAERLPFACVPRWIVADPRFTHRDVRVLAALTAWADLPDGARPSQRAVAEAGGMSHRTAQRGLEHLAELGIVDVEPRYDEHGGRLPNRYGIRPEYVYTDLDPPTSPAGTPPRQDCAPPRAHDVPPHVTSGHPPTSPAGRNENKDNETEDSETPSHPPPTTGSSDGGEGDVDVGFEEFWQAHPRRNGRRVGKKQAREKWRKLTYADKRDAYRAAVRYDAAVQRGETKAKDPVRFLQADYWRDWVDAPLGVADPADDPRNARANAQQDRRQRQIAALRERQARAEGD